VIQADPTALQVIFKNLLENSIRHSKKQKVFIQIRSKFQDQGVLLQILDNGPGYSGNVKTLGQLFLKGPVSQGTGVGLYLVRVLMERMNGKVYFDFPSGFQVGLWFPGETTHG
jgi:signal transduction histidine kinase